jgi:2-oxoglutarate dehydrogenase complex dehydrogenase (E1) component-like enzyme
MTLLQVMGLLLHGDAAFAGQGLVAELLQMSNVPGGQAMASQEL